MCPFQIHTHGSNWTSFHEQLPKEVLPTEYGGKDGSVAEHWGESKDHEKHEIVNLYGRFISMRIANAPQNITKLE